MLSRFLTLSITTLLIGGVAESSFAQGLGSGGPPGPPDRLRGRGMNPIAPLIAARRELNLTPRQLVALDSIERQLQARHEQFARAMRPQHDSMRAEFRPGEMNDSVRRSAMRQRMEAMRPMRESLMRNDSISRAAAFAVLDTVQRVQARYIFERDGSRGRVARMRPPHGHDIGPRGFAPRGRMRPGGEMRPRDGMRRREFGPGGPGRPMPDFGPDDARPRRPRPLRPDPDSTPPA